MDQAREELRGCPYSLPDNLELDTGIADLVESESKLRGGIEEASAKLRAAGTFTEVSGSQRAREIYESNAIEGVGLGLRETSEVLVSDMGKTATEAVCRGMLVTSFLSDRKLIDVLGLHGAKIIAEDMIQDLDAGRPITESDIRGLHEMITAGESYAGRYKRYINSIEGSDHETPFPSDTPAAMSQLASWLNTTTTLPPTFQAAVAHAWLTHIHPFEDGNGRLARVLVNLIMTRAQLPPVVLNHKSDRATYIDALQVSDEAGDILPLIQSFRQVQKRFIREVNKPRYLRQLIQEQVEQNTASAYQQWRKQFDAFMQRLQVELASYRISYRAYGEVDVNAFQLLLERDADGNSWLGFAGPVGEEADILLWIGYSSPEINAPIESPRRYPSLYFSIRNPAFSRQPFRQARGANSEFNGLFEATLVPDLHTQVYARFQRPTGSPVVRKGGLTDSAVEIAECIVKECNSQRHKQ